MTPSQSEGGTQGNYASDLGGEIAQVESEFNVVIIAFH